MTTWPPVSSEEAREQREVEAEQERALVEQRAALATELEQRQRDHETRCLRGWLDDPDADHPRPCIVCRPTLGRVACRGCGEHPARCASAIEQGRGSCCSSCAHVRGESG